MPWRGNSGGPSHLIGGTLARSEWSPGILADLAFANLETRLKCFILDCDSEPLALFTEESRAQSRSGDWYGEHLGKWLVAASHAAIRTKDPRLEEHISKVVQTVAAMQEPDGYLGTYASDSIARMTNLGSKDVRTWDVWVHSWTVLGLLDASKVPGVKGGIETADRIGRLLLDVFPDRHSSPLDLGNHAGLSSAVVLEPLVRLWEETNDARYLDMAVRTLNDAEARGLSFLSTCPDNDDVAQIGTGKIYQILWILVGMVRLSQATQDKALLRSVELLWNDVRTHHLTPQGGPWGGIATHKEVFNPRGFFSPYGMVETCSTATWMQLCLELFQVTHQEKYIAEYETSLLNALLGSVDETCQDWSYFTSPNGRRLSTYYWACCRSSGSMAVESSSDAAIFETDHEIFVNLYLPTRSTMSRGTLTIKGDLGVDGNCELEFGLAGFHDVLFRVPNWASNFRIVVGDEAHVPSVNAGFFKLGRDWRLGDVVHVSCECPIRVVPKSHTVDHHGQEVVRMDYATVMRGPLSYATGLIDGYKQEETVRIPRLTPESPFRTVDRLGGHYGVPIEFCQPGRKPIVLLPYFEAAGRSEGKWRASWLQVAWQ